MAVTKNLYKGTNVSSIVGGVAVSTTPAAIAGNVEVNNTVATVGPLTNTQLRATDVPVTSNAGTDLNTSALALDTTLTSGVQKTEISEYQTGHNAYVDQFHNLQVAESTRLVGTTFIGTTKDTNFWVETVLNSASVAQASGLITLTSGTDTAGSITYQSSRKARFVPVMANMFRAVGKMDSGIASNKRIWGMFDGTDGAWFQLDGTTFGIATKAGAAAAVVVTAANFNKSTFTMDTNFHGYEIRCGYDSYHFYIDGVLVHEITVAGSSSLPSNTLTLPVYLQNINSGNTTSKTMSFVLCAIYRLGKLNTAPQFARISTATTTVLKYGAGMLHKICVNNPTNNAITIYDNTSAAGTVIAIITPVTTNPPFTMDYQVGFSTGLTVVTAGTPDITVVYE